MTVPFCVKRCMGSSRHNPQIFYTMVRSVAVNVMHDFIKFQPTPKFLLHQLPMDRNSASTAPTFCEVNISTLVEVTHTVWLPFSKWCPRFLGSFVAAFTQIMHKRLTTAAFDITVCGKRVIDMLRAPTSVFSKIVTMLYITRRPIRLPLIASFSGVAMFSPALIVHPAHISLFNQPWAIGTVHSS